MKLTILGSGTFFITEEISASAFIIESNTKTMLIDCGPGTLVKLAKAGYAIEDLDYVFITHFHPDHSSDLFPLFMNSRLNELFLNDPNVHYPQFYGPSGLKDFMIGYSKLTELHAIDNWEKAIFNDYQDELQIDDFMLKTYKVEHSAFNHSAKAYALRFEFEDLVISFSGDSTDCKGVRYASNNADLFICDASFPGDKKNPAHMTAKEVGEIATSSNVKRLLLDHFYPHFKTSDIINDISKYYDGEIIQAIDLDVIEI